VIPSRRRSRAARRRGLSEQAIGLRAALTLWEGTPVMQAEMHELRRQMVDRRWLLLITAMVPA
jgi:hypothetical protein